MIAAKFFAKIVKGHIVLGDAELFADYLKRYEGKDIEFCIQAKQHPKSQEQLGYLFGHIIPQIARHLGYTDEEMYGLLKGHFLRKVITAGITRSYVQSLTELNRQELSTFIENCIRFGIEYGAEIFPAEVYWGKK